MLITCPECSSSISDKAVSCPRCGFPLSPAVNLPVPPKPAVHCAPRTKKKHMRLPNGFGTVRKLSGNRRRPYAAYPPTHKSEYNDFGVPPTKPALGYFETWYDAYDCLAEYNRNPASVNARGLTFADVYTMYHKSKFEDSKREYSKSTIAAATTAYGNCSALYDRKFASLVTSDLQAVVDKCPLRHASLELITNLFNQMYSYAIANNLVSTNYAQYVKINIKNDDESGVPFTEDEIRLLWSHVGDGKSVAMILIMIYSGYRLSAYDSIIVNTDDWYFQGGVKTAASKGRYVPIHSAIQPLIPSFTGRKRFRSATFRTVEFYPALERLGILYAASGEKHTPHDCRHTFSWLCDRYGVGSVDKHLLMGHTLRGDVEDTHYAHRTLDELRASVERIQVPS